MQATAVDPLAYISARCGVCACCGEPWHWLGSDNGHGHPKVYSRRTGSYTVARREVFILARRAGRPLDKSQLVTSDCPNKSCLNPALLVLTSKAEVSRKTLARPDIRLKRRMRMASIQRQAVGKITMEIARQMRAGDKPGTQWARELGVSASLVSHVRVHKSWVEIGKDPFAGLGARQGRGAVA